jgi:hypothetical protein
MKRLILGGVLVLAGCQNIAGPFQPRGPGRVDDPLLPIGEQQRRGRDRYALPEDSPNLAPPITARPGAPGFEKSQSPDR